MEVPIKDIGEQKVRKIFEDNLQISDGTHHSSVDISVKESGLSKLIYEKC